MTKQSFFKRSLKEVAGATCLTGFRSLRNVAMIACLAVTTMTFAGCDPEKDDPIDDPKITVTSTGNIGNIYIGDKLTATSVNGNFTGDFSWSYADENSSANWNNLPGATGENNSVQVIPATAAGGVSLIGKYIRVQRQESSGTIWNYLGQIHGIEVRLDTKGIDKEPIHEGNVTVGYGSALTVWAYSNAHGSWGMARTERNYTVKWFLNDVELTLSNSTDPYSIFLMAPGFTSTQHDRYSLSAEDNGKTLKAVVTYNGKTAFAETILNIQL
jgi:hypothetical protein